MKWILQKKEKAEYEAWKKITDGNREVLRLFCRYLNECPTVVSRDSVAELVASCRVSREEAFCALLAAAFGIEEENGGVEEALVRTYLPRAVRCLAKEDYENDPYYRRIRVPNEKHGAWTLCHETYAPCEGFIAGPLLKDGEREIPPLGFFFDGFSFPAVMQNGVEWMAIKPNEIETMRAPIAAAEGEVLTYGLGLGYFAYMASRKENVRRVTVVEKDKEVISLFREIILPQFENPDKITVIEGDALLYAEEEHPASRFDYIFADLWHDSGDGLPLYCRLRRAEEKGGHYGYWIEDQILSRLRAMAAEEGVRSLNGKEDGKPVYGMAAMRALLSDASLRRLAKDVFPLAK